MTKKNGWAVEFEGARGIEMVYLTRTSGKTRHGQMSISKDGINAVLELAKTTQHYKKMVRDMQAKYTREGWGECNGLSSKMILTPEGEAITQY